MRLACPSPQRRFGRLAKAAMMRRSGKQNTAPEPKTTNSGFRSSKAAKSSMHNDSAEEDGVSVSHGLMILSGSTMTALLTLPPLMATKPGPCPVMALMPVNGSRCSFTGVEFGFARMKLLRRTKTPQAANYYSDSNSSAPGPSATHQPP